MTKPEIVVPAATYDAFEHSCQMYGGIGAWRPYTLDAGKLVPCCRLGHEERMLVEGLRIPSLRKFGISVGVNDGAVERINARKGVRYKGTRVSWAEYCEELNIVRGE